MELLIKIIEDEKRFIKDKFALYLAGRDFIKRLNENETAGKIDDE